MKRAFLSLALLFFLANISSGEENSGQSFIVKGRNDLDAGQYADAIESFSVAYTKLPVIGDYILLWISKAYRESGNLNESNSTIKKLLKKYPDSPLRRKALSMQIRNIIGSNEPPQDLQIFESYIKDYPEDQEVKFLFAQLLKKGGETERAKIIFKNLFISCSGVFSGLALNELSPSDITLQTLMDKAANLTDAMEYQKAEATLREALQKDNGRHKAEILKKLGAVVFKQKRYRESAEICDKAGDYYLKTKALYRAGEKNEFDSALKKLASMGDKRAGSLFLWAASDKRRDKDADAALTIYKNVKLTYPSEAEDSLWGMGWTYYLSGDYQSAYDIFSELCNLFGGSKYLYWKARAMEKTGKDTGNIYSQLAGRKQDFYGVLAHFRDNRDAKKPSVEEASRSCPNSNGLIDGSDVSGKTNMDTQAHPALKAGSGSGPRPFRSERVDILMELNMKQEAATELAAIARRTSNSDELASISSKLQETEDYRLSLTLASRLQYSEALHGILYPLANWPVVQETSARYGIDPFIVLSIMREESRFDPDARSQAGALGLMQLMPKTAYNIDRKINLNITSKEQIIDLKTNIALGSFYLNSLIKEFASLAAAAAAYNAGEDAVRKWQRAGDYKSYDEFIEDIPYDETKNYVKRVLTTYSEYLRYYTGKDILSPL